MAKEKKKADAAAAVPEEAYVTLGKEGRGELTEKKSVFIGQASPARTEADALAFIEEVRHRHGDAAHNVYAYITAKGAQARYTDGGEPQGTAGVPILDVIRKNRFTDAVIVVTRYFGGILLGAGGLVRAYSAAAKLAVDDAGIVTYVPWTTFTLTCSYPDYQKLQVELPKLGAVQDGVAFTESITLTLAAEATLFDGLAAKVSEMTGGRVRPVITGQRFGVSQQ